jgi:O-antigen ligase
LRVPGSPLSVLPYTRGCATLNRRIQDVWVRGGIDRGAVLETVQSVLLGVAILLLFQSTDLRDSNLLIVVWLVLALLRRAEARPWSLLVLGLLVLNTRGVVLDEGPMPVSPVDYILMVAAFLSGYGRSQAWWLRQASVVALATMVGVLLHLEVVVDFARFGVEYSIAALTKNQTALLAGLALICSVVGGLACRPPLLRLLHGIALVAAALLLRAADSRAGLGMACLALLGAGLVVLATPLRALGRRGPGRLRPPLLLVCAALLAAGIGLWLFAHHQGGQGVAPIEDGIVGQMYGQENLENDAARLNLWGCYFGLPFTGDNRFIWGVGYEKAWRVWCNAEKLGRPLSHAHNFILQVWGENGVAGALFVLSWLGWIVSRAIGNARRLSLEGNPVMVFACLALITYLIGFNLFELGIMKVPLLLFCFGLFLASPFYSRPGAHQREPALINPPLAG